MNILYWNIRGIGNNDSRLALADLCRLHNPSLVFIAEPMVAYDSVPSWFWRNIHVSNYYLNNRAPLIPNMWAVWGSDFVYKVIFVFS